MTYCAFLCRKEKNKEDCIERCENGVVEYVIEPNVTKTKN
jgi:hypothetical protein